jgi:predicted DNA-binding transcriptional regulator AlpA
VPLLRLGAPTARAGTTASWTTCDPDRDAPSLLDAVLPTVEAVESVEGFEVLHVDPDELVRASEIAARTGRSRQSVDQLIKGQSGPGGFPLPASHATRNPLWRWSEVEDWFARYEGCQPEVERLAS